MNRYVPKRTRTRSTMRRKSKLTRTLVGGCATLTLASLLLLPGQEQDYVPTASPMLQSTVVSQEPVNAVLPSVQPSIEPIAKYTSYEITITAQTVWGEARGCSREEQMLVVWCICNRADARDQSIEQVVTAESQFHGYDSENPVESDIVEVVEEVFEAWARNETALVYPPYATTSVYQYFSGDGTHNWFREEY